MYGLEGVVRLPMYLCIVEGVRTPFMYCWGVLCMYCFGSPACLGALAPFVDCWEVLWLSGVGELFICKLGGGWRWGCGRA